MLWQSFKKYESWYSPTRRVLAHSTNNNIHYTLQSPPLPSSASQVIWSLLHSALLPPSAFIPFRYSTSGGPPNSICLHLRPAAVGAEAVGVPHHVRVTRDSAKGRGRDLARPPAANASRGPLPIHVSKQASSNLPCLNQGFPRGILDLFRSKEAVVDLVAVVTEGGKGRTFPHPINFHPPKSPSLLLISFSFSSTAAPSVSLSGTPRPPPYLRTRPVRLRLS